MPNRRETVAQKNARLKKERSHRRWTKREEEELRRRVLKGMWLDDIAREHQRSPYAIETRATKLQLGPLRRNPAATSKTASGTISAGARQRLAPAGHKTTTKKTGLLRRLFGS